MALHFRCLKSCSFASPFRNFALLLFRTFAVSHRPFVVSHRPFAVLQSRCFVLSLFRTNFVVSHFRSSELLFFRCFVLSLFRTKFVMVNATVFHASIHLSAETMM